MNTDEFLDFRPDVKEALATNFPVVALESTIISHGLPYPENVELALTLEKIVRDNGGIPATIGLAEGKIKIGLTPDEIEFLGKTGTKVHKTSRRDLAYVLSKRLPGATTVSATMWAAYRSGIKLFATGGIGGVHREARESFDISADLEEFGRTPVCVVSSGVKSILDIGATLEYLETKGVPVITYGQKEFPAFYTRSSGFHSPFSEYNPDELAKTVRTHFDLSVQTGILVANPIPREYALDKDYIDKIIAEALAEQRRKKITGKEITPFLLAKIVEKTEGESLKANLALVKNNARLASILARKILLK